jgi:hypothetical protein
MITYELNHECLTDSHDQCTTETYNVIRDGRQIGEATYWRQLRVWTLGDENPYAGGYPTREAATESL